MKLYSLKVMNFIKIINMLIAVLNNIFMIKFLLLYKRLRLKGSTLSWRLGRRWYSVVHRKEATSALKKVARVALQCLHCTRIQLVITLYHFSHQHADICWIMLVGKSKLQLRTIERCCCTASVAGVWRRRSSSLWLQSATLKSPRIAFFP